MGAKRHDVRDELVRYFDELSTGEREGVVWVSLEGESGAGKTRIVQEFYERIAADQTVYPKSLRPSGLESHARKSVAHSREAGGVGLDKGEGLASFAWVGVDCDLHASTSAGMGSLASAYTQLKETFSSRISGDVRPLAKMGEEGLTEVRDLAVNYLAEGVQVFGQTAEHALPAAKLVISGLQAVVKRQIALREEGKEQFIDADLASVDLLMGAFSELRGKLIGSNRQAVPVVMYVEDLHYANEAIAQLTLLLASLSVASGIKGKVKRTLRRQPSFPPILLVTSAWPPRLRDLAPDSQEALDEGEDLPAPARLAATLRAAHEGEQTLGRQRAASPPRARATVDVRSRRDRAGLCPRLPRRASAG